MGTITMKPKKVRETEVKPKVLTRPLDPPAANQCPRGGEHQWAEDELIGGGGRYCSKCKEPERVKPAAGEPDDYLLVDAVAFLLREPQFAWLQKLKEKPAHLLTIAEQMQERFHKNRVGDVGAVYLAGEGPCLHVHDRLTKTNVRSWDYAVVAAEVLRQERPASDKKAAAPARPNVHGVVTSGYETVRIPLPKTSKCDAIIRLAKLADGWRFGYELRRLQGGQSGGPSAKDTTYASRAAALEAAAIHARDYFAGATDHSPSEHAEAARCRQAMHAVQDFIDQLPPSSDVDGAMDLRDDEPPKIPAAALKPTARELPKPLSTGEMLELAKLKRHPLNRKPSEESIKARAESLQQDGQLEAVIVRMTAGGWQIISGETRCLAAQSIGWTTIRCDVIDCDDAEALRLVGLYNGQRTDLNSIQKAQHIHVMCQAGMTREEAARCVGLESGSAASNLVKLLELPSVWQDRVASGALPETWARSIAAYAHVPALLEELEKIWNLPVEYAERREVFDSRDELDESIQHILRETTRPMKGERYYSWDYFKDVKGDRPSGTYDVLLTKEERETHRAALGIVTLTLKEKQYKAGGKFTWKSEEVEVATNTALFDKLQIAHILEQSKAKGKEKAAAAGESADAGEKPAAKKQTPAQLKAAAEERARQLGHAIDNWRETVMRREIAAAMRAYKPTAKIDMRLLKLVLGFLADDLLHTTNVERELQLGLGAKKPNPLAGSYEVVQKALADGDAIKWQKAVLHISAYLVGGNEDDPRPLEFGDDVLQSLFDAWGCDLAKAWERLYAAKDPLIEEFFNHHRKDELADLVWELIGMKFGENESKSDLVHHLLHLSGGKPPKLPKSLQPAAKGKRGGK